jgi:hypothetical protein
MVFWPNQPAGPAFFMGQFQNPARFLELPHIFGIYRVEAPRVFMLNLTHNIRRAGIAPGKAL